MTSPDTDSRQPLLLDEIGSGADLSAVLYSLPFSEWHQFADTLGIFEAEMLERYFNEMEDSMRELTFLCSDARQSEESPIQIVQSIQARLADLYAINPTRPGELLMHFSDCAHTPAAIGLVTIAERLSPWINQKRIFEDVPFALGRIVQAEQFSIDPRTSTNDQVTEEAKSALAKVMYRCSLSPGGKTPFPYESTGSTLLGAIKALNEDAVRDWLTRAPEGNGEIWINVIRRSHVGQLTFGQLSTDTTELFLKKTLGLSFHTFEVSSEEAEGARSSMQFIRESCFNQLLIRLGDGEDSARPTIARLIADEYRAAYGPAVADSSATLTPGAVASLGARYLANVAQTVPRPELVFTLENDRVFALLDENARRLFIAQVARTQSPAQDKVLIANTTHLLAGVARG